jgi:hypothetical protein
MLVREKVTGEEWTFPLEMKLVPPFECPGDEWEYQEDGGKRPSYRHLKTGETKYPRPNSLWCLHVSELQETDYVPVRNLSLRHTGNWNLVKPGDDRDYEFTPQTDNERATLKEYGFTVTDRT